MTSAPPINRVTEILLEAGFRKIPMPLQVAGMEFDLAGAFVGSDYSPDLVVVGDIATDGEAKVVRQIEGVARALDVMRSHRPMTAVILGPRPIGKTLDALSQLGRVLPVEEASNQSELRDRLAVLLPLEVPENISGNYDLGDREDFALPDHALAGEFFEASKLGASEVKNRLYSALNEVLKEIDSSEPNGEEIER